jgi:hypothetical protein
MRASSTLPSMEGTLFTYYRDEYVNRVAFRSGNKAHRRHVVLIGGLGVSGEGAVVWRESWRGLGIGRVSVLVPCVGCVFAWRADWVGREVMRGERGRTGT